MSLDRFAQTIEVKTRAYAGVDKYNNKTYSYEISSFYPALVMPTEASEINGNVRPDGNSYHYTIQLPKTYTKDLENGQISVDGGYTWYDVISAPAPVEKSPLKYGRTIHIGRIHG